MKKINDLSYLRIGKPKARLGPGTTGRRKKKECAARGEDYEKVKLLEISAEDAERWEEEKEGGKAPTWGFSDYAAASFASIS